MIAVAAPFRVREGKMLRQRRMLDKNISVEQASPCLAFIKKGAVL